MIIRACCGGEGLDLCARGGGRTNQWMDAQRPDPRTIRVFPSRLGAGEASKAEPRRQEGGGGRRRLPVGAAEPEDQAAPPPPGGGIQEAAGPSFFCTAADGAEPC